MPDKNVNTNVSNDEDITLCDVPKLSELYESGYIDRVRNAYYNYKAVNKINNIDNLSEEEKIISIAYYSISVFLNCLPSLDINDIIKYNSSKYDEKILIDFLNGSVKQFEKDSVYYTLKYENEHKKKYDEYLIAIMSDLSHKPDIDEFMKNNYIVSVRKAVQKYFLGGHKLELEKIFSDITDEEAIKEAEYYIYSCLYNIYTKYYKSPFGKLRFKMEFRHMDLNQATYFIVSKLEELNESLFTKEEFYEIISDMKENIKQVIDLSKSQYNELKNEGYFNEKYRRTN
ncbi:MAG: hypothetical protein J5634_04320 [Bacilli bacterium]|nr:hypothetical protein [Bacilli bacterium]